jgi:hypothetical protein
VRGGEGADARVVYQDVDPVFRGLGRVAGQLRGRGRVAQVRRQEVGGPAPGADVVDDLLAAPLMTAGRQHPGAAPGQGQRGGPPDPARRSRYQGGPSGQLSRTHDGAHSSGLDCLIHTILEPERSQHFLDCSIRKMPGQGNGTELLTGGTR